MSGPTPNAADSAAIDHRIGKLESTIVTLKSKVKGMAIVSAIFAFLMGGGGLFGVITWAYSAETNKDKTVAETAVASLEITVKSQKEMIASLERDISRLEKAGIDPTDPTIEALKKKIDETEKQYREQLDRFLAQQTTQRARFAQFQSELAQSLDSSNKLLFEINRIEQFVETRVSDSNHEFQSKFDALNKSLSFHDDTLTKALRSLDTITKSQTDLKKKFNDLGIKDRRPNK